VMLARTVATLDHMLEGRLTLNVISSDFPGEVADSAFRYRRSHEVVEILRQGWTRDHIEYDGEIYKISRLTADPARPYQQNGGPLLYFGGYSPDALELCGAQCEVYLMWPEPKETIAQRMRDVHARAEAHGRTLDYGLRVHMIVRDTEAEAREYAEHLVSALNDEYGRLIRERAHDSISLGVADQARARTRRPLRLCRAPSLDGDRTRAVGLRRGAGRVGRSGHVGDRGIPPHGHPRLHLFGLPPPRRGGYLR